jgi:L-ascorbate metabolism protein UlaG (beta-lactamase superfamily)
MAIQLGDVQVTWLGHDGFLVAGKKNIYIDPFQIDNKNKPTADYLLITHSHHDHLSIQDIEYILTNDTTVVCPADCASNLSKFKMRQLKVLNPGEVFEEEGIRFEGVHAYNIGKQFHPKENDWLGFVITMDDVRVYHAGDTDLTPELKKVKCDIALLPVSGTYVMTAAEAVKAVDILKPEVAIPMHWGSLIGTMEDAQAFKKGTKIQVVILEKE